MPEDPKELMDWFKRTRFMFYPKNFAMENDYTAWGRKLEKFEDSIDGLSKEEQKKLVLKWKTENPPPVPAIDKEKEKKPFTKEELSKFSFDFPQTFDEKNRKS